MVHLGATMASIAKVPATVRARFSKFKSNLQIVTMRNTEFTTILYRPIVCYVRQQGLSDIPAPVMPAMLSAIACCLDVAIRPPGGKLQLRFLATCRGNSDR